ncbi:MAG TPA: S4 domain-containing protein, partial [Acidimicrobiales bacterium]
MVREAVPAALDGQRLDRVVAMVTGRSRTDVAALIGAGEVRVDGAVVDKGSTRLREGSVVELDDPGPAVVTIVVADPSVEVPVVYED